MRFKDNFSMFHNKPSLYALTSTIVVILYVEERRQGWYKSSLPPEPTPNTVVKLFS